MPAWFWILTIIIHIFTGWMGTEITRRRGGYPWLSGLLCLAGGIGAFLGLLLYFQIRNRA